MNKLKALAAALVLIAALLFISIPDVNYGQGPSYSYGYENEYENEYYDESSGY